MGNLFLSIIVAFIVLGGPLTLFAVIKILNFVFGGLKVRFAQPTGSKNIHIQVAWDHESFDLQIWRVKVEFNEMVKGGRSRAFSFTLEDSKAKKKSFAIPMSLTDDELACFTDKGAEGLKRAFQKSYFLIEVESTTGETQHFKISKAALQKQLSTNTQLAEDIEVTSELKPDAWSVLTRVFPWRKVVEAPTEAPASKSEGGHAPKPSGPRAPADFKVTKVWIEPGCIVCDACETEAPAVFWVKADTCVIRENAPLDDAAAIKAAAEGCPVDVIKYDKVALG